MTTLQNSKNSVKSAAAFGLAVLALGTLAAAPAGAQGFHPLRHQMRHAARLDRRAAHAAMMGHPRVAARMRAHATHLRRAARHGF